MTDITNSEQIKNYIDESVSVAIFVAGRATKEMILGGLALSNVLEQKGKSVSFYCVSEEVKELEFLEETHKIQNKIAPTDLIISLGYGKEEIEKVGYDTKEGQFTLVISPKKGRIDSSRITFGSASVQFDLIITIGAQGLEDLGDSYLDNTDEFVDKRLINIDNHERNSYFGSINEVNAENTPISQMIFYLLKELDVIWEANVSNLLLMGLYAGTNSFQSPEVTSQTFLAVSSLLQKGANVAYVTQNLYSKEVTPESTEEKDEEKMPETLLSQDNQPTPFVKKPDTSEKQEDSGQSQNYGEF